MFRTIVLSAAVATGLLLTSAAGAQSVTGYGSTVFTTLRSCVGIADDSRCDGGQGNSIIQSNTSGGAGLEASTTFAGTGIGDGSSAFGSVQFLGLGLPKIKAAAAAVGDVRVNSNVYFYQTYTYTGADPVEFGLAGNIHIDNSTTDGSSDPDYAGSFAHGAIVYAGLNIWTAASFFAFTDADSFIQNSQYFSSACGESGLLAAGNYGTGLPGGEQNYGFTTSSCAGGPLMLNNGDQFVVSGIMQFPVNRGGSIDATHTFTVTLDPSLPPEAQAALSEGLSYTAAPEPATWGMMLLGFGAVGMSARRRTARTLAA